MAHANWAFRQVFGERDSTEEPADGAPRTACLAATLEGLPVGEVGQGQTRCWMSLTQQGGHVDPAM